MRFLKLDRRTAMQAAKVGAAVGAGALAADLGGRILRGVSPTVAAFAAGGDLQAASVDLAGGVVIGGVALAALTFAAKKGPLAAKLAPFIFGGVVMRAAARPLGSRIAGAMDGIVGRFAPKVPKAAGLLADPARGLGGELAIPAGLWAEPTAGVGGELPMPAGFSGRISGELL